MRKRTKTMLIIIVFLLIFNVSSITISYSIFKVYNPLAAINGLAQVALMEKEYVQIQKYPKVIIADPNTSLEDFMHKSGYIETVIDDPMGVHDRRLHEFQLAEHQIYILQISCKYYSIWQWR